MSGDASLDRSARINGSFASDRDAEQGFAVSDEAAQRLTAAAEPVRWSRAAQSVTWAPDARERRRRGRSRSCKKRHPGLAKKLSFLTHLLQTLDMVVVAEMSGLYYMECSLFRLTIRCMGHFLYLSPKDESFPIFMPATIVHVLFVFVPNIVCIILHLFGPLPAGPDYNRGDQAGGTIIDFIGQQTPTHRVYYCLIDFVILLTQTLMLAVHTEREHLRAALKTFRLMLPVVEEPTIISSEHLDAAERGETRPSQAMASHDPSDMELQLMDRNDAAPLLSDASGGNSPIVPLTDVMVSGTAVIGEYNMLQSLLSASVGLERTAASSLQTLSYGATLAAMRARRRGASAHASSPRLRR
ncbi:hypothetical protein L249_3390 [Ophiocordyceps polyrhachis-furcata BCC 54312]|uniref:DUF1746 domain-containing protein n=1 Tax=Ophiocordyceps polyrhachis-furcata BCC 54312 TaxID=1330021 RepID=A0A367LMS1_9HYPO|nr:hypothetical protein L249_3390 [Ophiocordyceps polyrhachis-furcata BCC 54312]